MAFSNMIGDVTAVSSERLSDSELPAGGGDPTSSSDPYDMQRLMMKRRYRLSDALAATAAGHCWGRS